MFRDDLGPGTKQQGTTNAPKCQSVIFLPKTGPMRAAPRATGAAEWETETSHGDTWVLDLLLGAGKEVVDAKPG